MRAGTQGNSGLLGSGRSEARAEQYQQRSRRCKYGISPYNKIMGSGLSEALLTSLIEALPGMAVSTVMVALVLGPLMRLSDKFGESQKGLHKAFVTSLLGHGVQIAWVLLAAVLMSWLPLPGIVILLLADFVVPIFLWLLVVTKMYRTSFTTAVSVSLVVAIIVALARWLLGYLF